MKSPRRPSSVAFFAPIREADALVAQLGETARLLPALTATNAAEERLRLRESLERGSVPTPAWTLPKRRIDPKLYRMLDLARRKIEGHPLQTLYWDRLEELELELEMIDALGIPRRIRPLVVRRFGSGRDRVRLGKTELSLSSMASALLSGIDHEEEERVVAAVTHVKDEPSLASLIASLAAAAGIKIDVRVEPRLAAGAATGDRTVFIADRRFGARESLRFAVHEVLGHAVAAANARDQPIRLFEVGTAGAFCAQEGLALFLEENAGVLDAYRLRVIAARVLAADRMHEGARFGETARWLYREQGFSAADAITIAERAYRGGGVARDVGYLRGWLDVRNAIAAHEVSIDTVRAGRLGLDAARMLPQLVEMGAARPPRHCPSLAKSLSATDGGSRPLMSPPSVAASLTMLEET